MIIKCEHRDKMFFHARTGTETFEACKECADLENNYPEYYQECPHCGINIPVN